MTTTKKGRRRLCSLLLLAAHDRDTCSECKDRPELWPARSAVCEHGKPVDGQCTEWHPGDHASDIELVISVAFADDGAIVKDAARALASVSPEVVRAFDAPRVIEALHEFLLNTAEFVRLGDRFAAQVADEMGKRAAPNALEDPDLCAYPTLSPGKACSRKWVREVKGVRCCRQHAKERMAHFAELGLPLREQFADNHTAPLLAAGFCPRLLAPWAACDINAPRVRAELVEKGVYRIVRKNARVGLSVGDRIAKGVLVVEVHRDSYIVRCTAATAKRTRWGSLLCK